MPPKRDSTLTIIPSASRLIHSLRDIGYDFFSAVADLVDNSITAGASKVAVELRFAGAESWVRIADNGSGMPGTVLTEAMRYGAERPYEEDDLGKFGLGLKTASMSQCRRLTVASRTNPEQRRIEIRRLDLDHIEKSNRWEVFDLRTTDVHQDIVDPLEHQPGTVVMWEQLDRAFTYKIPDGQRARNGMLQMAERLELHLGMIFHRFLAGEALRKRKLTITVNGTTVEPWDPFCRREKQTKAIRPLELELETPVGSGVVTFTPYVLPAKSQFSDESAFNRASGPARWNRQQGFYIYREDRLIQSGGWCGLRTSDEHTKLARAAINFRRGLDAAFAINVAKMRVNLPGELREKLEKPVSDLARIALEQYRSGSGAAESTKSPAKSLSRRGKSDALPPLMVGEGRNSPRSAKGSTGSEPSVEMSVRHALEEAARKVGETDALARIITQLCTSSPEVARALGY